MPCGLAALVLGRVCPGTRTSDVSRSIHITLTAIVEEEEELISDDPGVTDVDGFKAADGVAGAGAADVVVGADAADCVEYVEVDTVVCGTRPKARGWWRARQQVQVPESGARIA